MAQTPHSLFTLQIFCAWAPDKLPPNTVKSYNQEWKEVSANTPVSSCTCMCFFFFLTVLYLAEHVNQPAIDPAPACHNAVTRELFKRQQKHKRSAQESGWKTWGTAATLFLSWSIPKSEQRCSTNMSVSTKESWSSRSSTRSLAVSLPWSTYISLHLWEASLWQTTDYAVHEYLKKYFSFMEI